MAEIDKLYIQIVNDEPYDKNEIVRHLIKTGNEERAELLSKFADAFRLRGESCLTQAEIFARRAFTVSKNKIKYGAKYIEILTALKDAEKLKKAYKRLGQEYLKLKKVKEAIECFDRWLYVYPETYKCDKYEYDDDILNSIDRYTSSMGFIPNSINDCISKKIKIGLLVKDITAFNSVLVKVNYQFAKYYDKDIYELYFFFPESEKQIFASKQGAGLLSQFRKEGVKVVCADECPDYSGQLLSVANKIKEEKILLLLTSAALSLFNHYFITSFKPAPLILGFSQGPPPQFIPPGIDWSIAWTYHPLIDSPVPTDYVKLQIDLPVKEDIKLSSKESWGIPEDSHVIYAGGRYVKFQDRQYIMSLLNIIKADEKRYLILAGFLKDQIPFIDDLTDEETMKRVIFIPWLENYLEVVRLCDLAIDTYPSSGGVLLLEIMALGVPVITFQNNYLYEFDQTDWTPFQEFFDIDLLKLERGDYEGITNLADRILKTEKLKIELGNKCAGVRKTAGNPEIMVSECEKVFRNLILNTILEKISGGLADDSILTHLPDKYKEQIPAAAVAFTEQMLADRKYKNVLGILELITKHFPGQPELLCNLGAANYFLGNKDRALEYLYEAAGIDKANHLYVMNIASILAAHKQIKEAIIVCNEFLSRNGLNKEVSEYLIELEKNVDLNQE